MKKHPWPFTRTQELQLVTLAQAGDKLARNKLYVGYEKHIESAHVHSGVGLYPTAFKKQYNPKGLTYEEYSGVLFELFIKVLETFDIAKASTGRHPFYTYFNKILGKRALDQVEKNKAEAEKALVSTAAIELGCHNSGKVNNVSKEGVHSSSYAYFDEDCIYDGNAVEYRQSKIRATVKKVLANLKDKRAGITCESFLDAAENGKPVILDLAEKLKISSGLVYYDFNAARKTLSSDEQDVAQELLYQAA